MTRHFFFTDSDGNELRLGNTAQTWVARYSGLGYAPVDHFLQPIPSQHGQLHRGYKFRPRTIQLEVWDFQSSTAAQDARHQTILDRLNVAKGEGIFRVVLDDGTERRIGCYVSQGPDFESEGRRDWFQSYLVRFIARDPFLYDPSQQSENGNFNGVTPVEIPLTNVGHIGTYPVITVAGVVNNPKMELITTGEYIQFDYNLTAGHLDIDCEEGTVFLDDAVMDPLKLTKASTLFYIPLGAQHIKLTATSGTGLVTVSWYSRFLGI